MRLRTKPWMRAELADASFLVHTPEENKNNWSKQFLQQHPLHIELGCGKGAFLAKSAAANPQINYIGIDVKSAVLASAVRNVHAAFAQSDPPNILLAQHDIQGIDEILGPQDICERIYINFCNPWPKASHEKRRLTYPRLLNKYKSFLPHGEIWFKTDDDALFTDSIGYFNQCGFSITYQTRDFANCGFDGYMGITTEHEQYYMQSGKAISFLIARI